MEDVLKGRGVGGRSQGIKESGTLFRGEVQLALTSVGNVDGDDAIDFFTKRLDRNFYIR